MSFSPALPTGSIFMHLRASPDSRLWRGACIPLVTGLLLKVSALLGVRRKIDYVGRKTSGNTYGISGLDVASDYRSGLARHWRAGIWLECLFKARRHSAVRYRPVEDGATGCTARHVLFERPSCSGRKGQHRPTGRPEGCHR